MRHWLVAIFFVGTISGCIIYFPFSIRHIAQIVTDDQNLSKDFINIRKQSERHFHHRIKKKGKYYLYRRFDIRAARKSYYSIPQIRIGYGPIPKINVTLSEIALAIPLFIAGYFMILGRLVQNAEIEEWLRFIWLSAPRFLGYDLGNSEVAKIPPTPRPILTWLEILRPWIEGGFVLLLLAEIVLSAALADELRLHEFAPRQVQYQFVSQVLALVVVGLYFCYGPVSRWIGRWRSFGTSRGRRAVMTTVPIVVLMSAVQPAGSILSYAVTHGRFPNPRYRRRKHRPRPIANLPKGLYRNPKSRKITYVDGRGRIACYDPIKVRRLIRVSEITEADFSSLSTLAAKICFEGQAKSALEKSDTMDALKWSYLGTRYEIYKKHRHLDHKINFRIVKLFAGLCYRYRFYGYLPRIRKYIMRLGLLAEFQPPPQKWLHKGGEFKARWRSRESYDGVPLPKI